MNDALAPGPSVCTREPWSAAGLRRATEREGAVDRRLRKALDRIEAERTRVEEKLTALDRFARAVRDVEATVPNGATVARAGGGTAALSPVLGHGNSGDRCRQIREQFTETVHPHSVEDFADTEPVVETLRAEFGDRIARQLAPDTDGRFTPEVKRAVQSATRQRRAETETMLRALDREDESVRDAIDGVGTVLGRIAAARNFDLLALGFEDLRDRHRQLAALRTRCDELARERQAIVHGTTSHAGTVGLTHRSLLSYLYDDLDVSYPVLTAIVELDDACSICQRRIRDQLTRRV